MADSTPPNLPAATLPLTTEEVSVWQGGEMRKATARDTIVAIVPPPAVSASRNLADSDNGKILRCTSAITLTVVTTLTNGFACMILNRSGGNVTVGQGAGLTLVGDTTVGDDHFATVVKDEATGAVSRASG